MNSHFYFRFSISLKAKSTYSLNTRNFIPPYKKHRNNVTTRMHSSRMHTAYHVPSASVHAGIQLPGCGPGDPPGCGPGDPPGCGLETPQVWAWRPPWPDPSTPPLGVSLETCKAYWDTTCNACYDTTPLWTE